MYKVDFGNNDVWYTMVDKPYVPSIKALPLVLLISDKESLDGIDMAAKTTELAIKHLDNDKIYTEYFKDLEYASLTSIAGSGFYEVKYNQKI